MYEVSQRPELTLEEAIGSGEVPEPELMRFQGWLAWRGGDGQRPARRKGDRVGTNGKFEADLWRATMERIYGEDWKTQMDAKELAELAPSSGEEQEEEELLPEASIAAGGPGMAAVPRASSIEEALVQLSVLLPEGEVEMLLFRAEVSGELEGASDPLRHLKVRFGEELADGSDSVESQRRLSVLIRMIQEKGGKLSSTADKLFSSEEGSPPRAAPAQVSPVARSLFKGPEAAVMSEPGRVANLGALGGGLAEVLKKQTELLQLALEKKPPKRSVQEFYDQFEATIALAQHRLKSYELIYKRHLNDGSLTRDPGAVYLAVKQKHLLDEWERLHKGRLSAHQWE
ncbi:pol, partial [Symbiodinium sp. CCMP2456]